MRPSHGVFALLAVALGAVAWLPRQPMPPAFTGTWTTVRPLARGRQFHTTTLLPTGQVLVVGGKYFNGAGEVALATCELFDPATGAWRAMGSLTTARYGHTATLLPSGQVLVAGGMAQAGASELSSAELFDPATGLWRATGSMSHVHAWHTATVLSGVTGTSINRVLVAGDASGTSAELYDVKAGTWTDTAPLNVGRAHHTAALLPSGQVLVAGGSNGTSPLASAELYTLASNGTGSWAVTGSLGSARAGHTATVLTSGTVLVAGGADATGSLATTELFDPTAIGCGSGNGCFAPAGPLKNARAHHSASLLPDGTLLVSGGSSGGSFLVATELYDTSLGAWRDAAPLNGARADHTATLLSAGRVLVVGGTGPARGLSSTEVYDYASGSWSRTFSMAAPRFGAPLALRPDGTLLMEGGVTDGGVTFNAAELYDGGNWDVAKPIGAARAYETATLLATGDVVFAGGTDDGISALNISDRFNNNGNTAVTGALNNARFSHTATLLPSGKVLASGGEDVSGAVSSAELYDSDGGTWGTTGSLAMGRVFHTATLLPSGKVLVVGGDGNAGSGLASAELYDPAAGTWSPTGPLTTGRSHHTATLLPTGKVLVTGGNGGSSGLSSAELYDPATGTWSGTGSMARGRAYHTATLLLSGKVLVAGGNGASNGLASAELYDPAAGTWAATGALLTGRASHTAALLPSGQVLVAGGKDSAGNALASAELYDEGRLAQPSWTPGAVGCSASGRGDASLLALLGTVSLLLRKRRAGLLVVAAALVPALAIAGKNLPTYTGVVTAGQPAFAFADVLTGVSEASSGGSQSSASNYPLALFQRQDNEAQTYVPFTSLSGSALIDGGVLQGITGVVPAWLAPGGYWVRAVVNGVPGPAASVLVLASVSNQLAFATPARTFVAGTCGDAAAPIIVQLEDPSGTPLLAGTSGQSFTATTTSAQGTFYLDNSCTQPAPGGAFTIPSGSPSVKLYYADTLAGSPTFALSTLANPSDAGSPGLALPMPQVATVLPGAAAQLAFTLHPSSTVAGAPISPAVEVTIEDVHGNPVPSASTSITLAILKNVGGGVLAGTATQAASSGVATFPGLSINAAGSGYTLQVAATGLSQAISAPFDITSGAATKLAFAVQPGDTLAGAIISPSVRLIVEDAQGNLVTSSSAPVTLALLNNAGGGALSGGQTVSASSGVATFSGLSIDRAGTGYTLQGTSAGLPAASSVTFNVLPGDPGPTPHLAVGCGCSSFEPTCAAALSCLALILSARRRRREGASR